MESEETKAVIAELLSNLTLDVVVDKYIDFHEDHIRVHVSLLYKGNVVTSDKCECSLYHNPTNKSY